MALLEKQTKYEAKPDQTTVAAIRMLGDQNWKKRDHIGGHCKNTLAKR